MTLSDRERQALAEIESQLRLHRPSRFWRLLGWLRYGLWGGRFGHRLPRPAGRPSRRFVPSRSFFAWPLRRREPNQPIRMISLRRALVLAVLALAAGVLIGLAFAL